jgi:hypothetical protein
MNEDNFRALLSNCLAFSNVHKLNEEKVIKECTIS